MEFKTTKEDLLNHLQKLSGIVERKHTLPILSHILLKLKDGVLCLKGSDSEIELNLSIKVNEISAGEITIPAHKTFDIVKKLNDQAEITFKKESDSKVIIYSEKSKFSLNALETDKFPNIESFTPINQFKIKQDKLLKLLKNISFCMATQDVRYYLNGALLHIKENKINTVSVDGHRLAMDSNTLDYDKEFQVIIPRKGILEIIKLLKETDEKADIKVSKNKLLLILGDISLVIRLIDGRYPEYEKVIPKNGDKEVFIKKNIFINALQRASILSNEKYRTIRLVFENNKVIIYANNSEKENAEDEIQLTYDYPKLEIGFNVSYLLDGINAIQSDTVKLTLKEAMDSCLVQYPDKNYPVFIVMPMKL